MKLKVKKGIKINSLPDDSHQDGTPGIIVCEVHENIRVENTNLYFVLFEDSAVIPIAVVETRMQILEEDIEEEVNPATINYLKRLPEEIIKFF